MQLIFLKRNNLLKGLVFTLIFFIALVPAIGFTACNPADGKICNPISVDSVNGFVKQLLEGIIKIGIPVVAIAIIYSGFLFVVAQGKPQAIEKAKNAFLYTIIGAAILLGAWAIAQIITNTVTSL